MLQPRTVRSAGRPRTIIPESRFRHHRPTTCAMPAAQLCSRASRKRRPQRPGAQPALTRVSGLPPAIHPREPPATAGFAVRPAGLKASRFRCHTLWGRTSRPATEKLRPVVKKLWTTKLLCGTLRKFGRGPPAPPIRGILTPTGKSKIANPFWQIRRSEK